MGLCDFVFSFAFPKESLQKHMIFIRVHNYLMCFGKILSPFKVSIIICKIFPHSPGFSAMLAIVKSFCGEITQIHQRCTAHGAHCDHLIFFG